MLRSMVKNPRPTRAEVADVFNAVLDGSDALMLSEESAVGAYPSKQSKFLQKLPRQPSIEFLPGVLSLHFLSPAALLPLKPLPKPQILLRFRLKQQLSSAALAKGRRLGSSRNTDRPKPLSLLLPRTKPCASSCLFGVYGPSFPKNLHRLMQ